jgi:hypothetical protein
MQAAINLLGALTVGLCAVLLLRAWGRVRRRLLLWSGLCFAGLTLANLLLLVDRAIGPGVDLYSTRLSVAALSLLVLVFGLVFESD